jgi:hypothetical protein
MLNQSISSSLVILDYCNMDIRAALNFEVLLIVVKNKEKMFYNVLSEESGSELFGVCQ